MRRLRQTIHDTDNTILAIVFAAFLVVMVIVLPRVIPNGRFGVACTALASPIPGGNNQSILARARADETLELEVSLPRSNVQLGEPFTVNVTFVNTGVATITLFLKADEIFFGEDGADGLGIIIRGVGNDQRYSQTVGLNRQRSRAQFTNETLHLLGPKQRCTETITIEGPRFTELTNANGQGVSPGGYRVSAVYRNRSAGTSILTGSEAPIFPDQGVYITTQDAISNEESFTVGGAPAG